MNLRSFAYFLAIVDEGSISKAAKKLYISQPALSHFLANLETEFGVMLFYRQKQSPLRLTEAGEDFAKVARGILTSWEEFQNRLELYDGAQKQKVTIGVALQEWPGLMDVIIAKINEKYPNIVVEIMHGPPDSLQQRVIDGEIDLGYSAYDKKMPQLSYYRMEYEEVDLLLPLNHPMAGCSYLLPGNENVRISLSEMAQDTFVLPQLGTVIYSVEQNYFKEVGFTPNIRIRTDHSIDSIHFVEKLGCLGFCPRINLNKALHHVAPIALDPPMYYGGGIYYKKNGKFSPAIIDFIKLIKETYPSPLDGSDEE